jgi:hypothetical protein
MEITSMLESGKEKVPQVLFLFQRLEIPDVILIEAKALAAEGGGFMGTYSS